MQIQTLNGFWQVRRAGTQDWLPARVPGGVHTDLMAAGKLPDPFEGTNEEKVQWVAEKNWEYRRYFYPLISEFPMYRGLQSAHRDNLPMASAAALQVLCLPIYPDLAPAEVERITAFIAAQ